VPEVQTALGHSSAASEPLEYSSEMMSSQMPPMKPADDAAHIDTTTLTIDETFAKALEITKQAIAAPAKKKASAKPPKSRTRT
jgi:hypothetical protein